MYRQLGKRFAVQSDVRFLQRGNEPGIIQTFGPECGADTDGPKRPEIPLLPLAVPIGVLTGLDDGFLRFFYRAAPHAAITFGQAVQGLYPPMPVDSAFYSH